MKSFYIKLTIAILGILLLGVAFYFWRTEISLAQIEVTDWAFIPILISGALIDSINPCAFSVLLITLAFLIATSASRFRFLTVGGSFIAGIFVVYFLIGVGMLKAMSLIGAPYFIARFGIGLLILIGVSEILSHYFPNFPIQFRLPEFIKGRMASLIKQATYPTAFALGALVAVFEFPCTGGPYFVILSLIHKGEQYGLGLIYLALYNLIFIAPLLVLLFLAGDKKMQEKAEEWKKKAAGKGRIYAGLAMIILAIVIFLTL